MGEHAVIVVGAGPSGAATALLLARAGHHVAVFDRATFPRDKACGEGLMPPGVAVLRRLGVFERVLAIDARRIDGVSYTDRDQRRTAYAAFPRPAGGDAWALGVRRITFDAVLVDALRHEPTVDLHENALVSGLVRDSSGAIVGVRTAGGEHRAQMIVAADGLHSRMRAWAGLSAPSSGDGRYGLAGHWRLDVSARRSITVTFAAGHEWYAAPVGAQTLLVSVLGNRRVFGTVARRYAEKARAVIPELHDAELLSEPLAAGLFRQRARAVTSGSLFLVGDAAGYEDPTTGEGLAIGLELAERASAHIDAVLRGETALSTAARAYEHDHAALWRERRRLIRLALLMAGSRLLSRRAIGKAATDPSALRKLLAVNCGYVGFRELGVRDWLALAGV